jgi:hypothetical protein
MGFFAMLKRGVLPLVEMTIFYAALGMEMDTGLRLKPEGV